MPPSNHPQAQFVPVPPDLDLNALVSKTPNFDYITRISYETLQQLTSLSLEQLVLRDVVIGGKPLVLEGWDGRLPSDFFSSAWLQENVGKKRG